MTKFRDVKTRGVLALLVLYPGGRSRDWLGETLWPGDLEELQRGRLRYALTMARSALDKTVFSANGNNFLTLSGACTSDIGQWRHNAAVALRETNASYRAEQLETLLAGGLPLLLPNIEEEWAVQARYEWDGELEKVVRAAIQALTEIRRTERAEHWIQVYEERFPDREPPEPIEPDPILKSDSFIGRKDEFLFLRGWLRASERQERLVTITGPGGIGKTRLAREASEGRPILWVPLADCTELGRAWDVLRLALDLPPTDTPENSICECLNRADTPRVLLLDNLEQLAVGAAQLVSLILEQCPKISVLATSQCRLELPEERVILLQSLTAQQGFSLFLARARSKRSDFAGRVEAQAIVRDICRLLDGIPLAIELAAARANLLGPAQIREQLDNALRFLTTRSPDLPDRHRSVSAALNWSVALLSESARQILGKLSLFRGGCSPEAVLAICGEAALDDIDELVTYSLVSVDFESTEVSRFKLLSVISSYANETLVENIDEERCKFVEYFFKLADSSEILNLEQSVEYLNDRVDLKVIGDKFETVSFVLQEYGDWVFLDKFLDWISNADREVNFVNFSQYCSRRVVIARRRGDTVNSIHYMNLRLEYLRESDNRAHLKDCLMDFTDYAMDIGDIGLASRLLNESAEIKSGDIDYDLYHQLLSARLKEKTCDFDTAFLICSDILSGESFQGIGGAKKVAYYLKMADILRKCSRIKEAENTFVLGLKLASEFKQKFALGWGFLELGKLYESTGRLHEAYEVYWLSAEIHRELRSRLMQISLENFQSICKKISITLSEELWEAASLRWLSVR